MSGIIKESMAELIELYSRRRMNLRRTALELIPEALKDGRNTFDAERYYHIEDNGGITAGLDGWYYHFFPDDGLEINPDPSTRITRFWMGDDPDYQKLAKHFAIARSSSRYLFFPSSYNTNLELIQSRVKETIKDE